MAGPPDHEEQRVGRTRAAERPMREAEETEVAGMAETIEEGEQHQEEQSAVIGGLLQIQVLVFSRR